MKRLYTNNYIHPFGPLVDREGVVGGLHLLVDHLVPLLHFHGRRGRGGRHDVGDGGEVPVHVLGGQQELGEDGNKNV